MGSSLSNIVLERACSYDRCKPIIVMSKKFAFDLGTPNNYFDLKVNRCETLL